jgi:hypothetical protein
VVASITSVSVISGNASNKLITFTPAPGMLNVIVSAPSVVLACAMAARKEPIPSLLAFVTTMLWRPAAKFAVCDALRLLKIRLEGTKAKLVSDGVTV